jgi:hypothetical protein
MELSGGESLWEKAFQLAYFIVADRASAYQIAGAAVEKLDAQRCREKRRFYWRFRKTRLRTRRITRTDEDRLQWLVYVESEHYEKEQERNDHQSETDMVIRYIKHLVQMTTGASSFYVNVGLNRLLRNYSTPEVQQFYEFITERYPAAEEYRKVKGRLLNQLAARFDGFIKVCTAQYRELRFESYEDQQRWMDLVDECLEAFTPWSSSRACLQGPIPAELGAVGTSLRRRILPSQVDGIETNRCHWFMHSPCYGELAKRLRLDPPEERLSVPKFFSKDAGSGADSSAAGRKTVPLTPAEMQGLKERMASGEQRRQGTPLQPVKIVVHGVVCARLDPAQDETRQFAVLDGTQLLEVRTDVAGDDLLLATHWIDYTECNGMAAGEYRFALKSRRELTLKIVPANRGSAQEGGATIVVASRASLPLYVEFVSFFRVAPQNRLRYAFAAVVLMGLGWLGATLRDRSKLADEQSRVVKLLAEAARNTPTVSTEQMSSLSAPTIRTYSLASDDASLRGPGNPKEPVLTFPPREPLIRLNLSFAQAEHGSYRATLTPFVEDREIITENSLKPILKDGQWLVEFALPASLVADKTHYLIKLAPSNNNGRKRPVARFAFMVRK